VAIEQRAVEFLLGLVDKSTQACQNDNTKRTILSVNERGYEQWKYGSLPHGKSWIWDFVS